MTTRAGGLFVVAVLGLLTIVGLALAPLGWLVEGPYLAIVLTGWVVLSRQARSLRRSQEPPDDGRTCSCCTSTVFDPVEIR
jgi:hypothetical protein